MVPDYKITLTINEPTMRMIRLKARELNAGLTKMKQAQHGSTNGSQVDRSDLGIAILLRWDREKRKPTVVELAKELDVTRSTLNQSKEFEHLRKFANTMFGLFKKVGSKNDFEGPRGSKSANGEMESWENESR